MEAIASNAARLICMVVDLILVGRAIPILRTNRISILLGITGTNIQPKHAQLGVRNPFQVKNPYDR